jgi:hypothetical protein
MFRIPFVKAPNSWCNTHQFRHPSMFSATAVDLHIAQVRSKGDTSKACRYCAWNSGKDL